MWAAWFGREEAVRALVRSGADLNAKSGAGESALSIAVARGYEKVAQYLRESGARDEAPPEMEEAPKQEYSS